MCEPDIYNIALKPCDSSITRHYILDTYIIVLSQKRHGTPDADKALDSPGILYSLHLIITDFCRFLKRESAFLSYMIHTIGYFA